jgi:hypothetical protein
MANEDSETADAQAGEPKLISFAEFLQNISPSTLSEVTSSLRVPSSGPVHARGLNTPPVKFYRDNTHCDGTMIYRYFGSERRCHQVFALSQEVGGSDPDAEGTCYKFGESPPFGLLHLLASVSSLEKSAIFSSRVAGARIKVSASAHLRTIDVFVENQKNQLLEEMIKVC